MVATPDSILKEVLIIEPRVFRDTRGYFMETFQSERYAGCGIPGPFVQDNLSFSTRGVLRGLHYQIGRAQGKLVQVLQGEVFDVAVDIRQGSPTFGRWTGVVLSAENNRQLYIPAGFAHGFCVRSETALFIYKCTDYYDTASERGLRWDDPELAIDWRIEKPVVSDKDRVYPTLAETGSANLPIYR
jgi:dTDP-4-dehydrorhamnose 3,5-epimerase